jgi:glycerol-3-phosphate dehydrogenase
LEDARQIAEAAGIPLRIFTYHRVTIDGQTATVHPLDRPDETAFSFQPSAVINATGAWVDRTLSALNVPSKPLMGGTKGSHFITHHEPLRARLAGRAIYVEAADGRPVFVLPFGQATLVGTTDLPFADDPANAVAAPEELQYLVEAVNELFPDLRLSTADIALHYSGVRPLPVSDASATAAVTRRHWLEPNNQSAVPLYSIIGGKLTTCRSLAEDAAGTILARLGLEQRSNSRDRPLPGGESYPRDSVSLAAEWDRIAQRFSLDRRAVETIWSLVGTRSETILADLSRAGSLDSECLPGTSLPRRFVRWIIDHEWATTLDDLVERRLMLLYHPRLSRACLDELAQLLVQSRRMSGPPMAEVEKTIARLAKHFGKSFS